MKRSYLKNKKVQKIAQCRPEVREKKRLAMQTFYDDPSYVSPCARKVVQVTLDGVEIAVFRSAKDASRVFGINYTKITEVARGKRRQSGGFLWRYL